MMERRSNWRLGHAHFGSNFRSMLYGLILIFFGVQSGSKFDDHCFLGHQTDLRYACHVKFGFVGSDGKREYSGVLDSTRHLV